MTQTKQPKTLTMADCREMGPGEAFRHITTLAQSGTPVLVETSSFRQAEEFSPAFTNEKLGIVAEPAGMSLLVRENKSMRVQLGRNVKSLEEVETTPRFRTESNITYTKPLK